jgi:hypothetical protein
MYIYIVIRWLYKERGAVELVKQVWEIPTNIKRDLLVVMTLSAKMITEATVKIIYSDSENHTYF